jgi:chlorobactene lauroyltransferase
LKKPETTFIPADESHWFIALFDHYVRFLFRRRFYRVWTDLSYNPSQENKTIYYLNHTSWWDGLIPLLLNRKMFRQNARAMMEDKQMNEHRFFKKIGAFSVNLSNPRAVITSLRYAVTSMQRPQACLFIYPEGEIVPFSIQKPSFKKGLAWIAKKCPAADVVPIGIYFSHKASDKPELFLKIGRALEFDRRENEETLNTFFEMELQHLLQKLQQEAHSDQHSFKKI